MYKYTTSISAPTYFALAAYLACSSAHCADSRELLYNEFSESARDLWYIVVYSWRETVACALWSVVHEAFTMRLFMGSIGLICLCIFWLFRGQ